MVALFGLYYGGYEGVIEPRLPGHGDFYSSGHTTQIVVGAFLILLGLGIARIASEFLSRGHQPPNEEENKSTDQAGG